MRQVKPDSFNAIEVLSILPHLNRQFLHHSSTPMRITPPFVLANAAISGCRTSLFSLVIYYGVYHDCCMTST